MQNKSYEHYVELLRAAELQTLERTSGRFLASLGTASAGSWLTSNPLASAIAAIGAIVFVAVSAYSVWTGDTDPTMQTLQKRSSVNATVNPATPSIAQSNRSQENIKRAAIATQQIIEVTEAGASAANGLVQSSESNEVIKDITRVVVRHPEVGEIASTEVKALRVTPLGIEYVDRVPHNWAISLTALNLPSFIYHGDKPDFRTIAWLETGNGFALGLSVGVRSINEITSDFSGFRDTVFMIDDREYTSKIGQFRSSSALSSNLEAGIAASYQFLNASESARLRPAISVFAGLEGRAVVLEQCLTLNLHLNPQLSAFGGVSIREYPLMATSAIRVSPVLGFRFGF
jgi:hypothetical protein